MNACTRSSSVAPLGPDDEHRQAVLADLVDSVREVARVGQAQQARGSSSQRAEQLAHQPGQVRAQPRHAAELQRVRHLVQRDPAQQLVRLGARGWRAAWPRFGATNSSRAGALGLEHRELVLAEHAAGEEAGDRARLERQHAPAARHDAAQRPGPAAGEPLDDRLQHGRQRRRGWRRSSRARSTASARGIVRGRRGRCRRRRAARLSAAGLGGCSNGAGSPAGCRSATPRATVPASFQSITASRWQARSLTARPARVRARPARSGVRAATTGERGSRSSGAPSGSLARDEGHLPARLAHDQLRGRGVHGAAALQR